MRFDDFGRRWRLVGVSCFDIVSSCLLRVPRSGRPRRPGTFMESWPDLRRKPYKQIPSHRFAIEKTDHDAPLGTAVVGKRKVPRLRSGLQILWVRPARI